MNKLLVICGPTATGKTSLGLHLAKLFNGEIISADSRQVYKGLDIGTGKDVPKNEKTKRLKNLKYPYYEINGIKLWGYDLVGPKEEFSVSHYIEIAKRIIRDIHERKKLPILLGGTGLYIKGVVDGIETSIVPKDENLRQELKSKNTDELTALLSDISKVKLGAMNESDIKNPRRLIRAIEIESWKKENNISDINNVNEYNYLIVGIKGPKDIIYKKIEERVAERIDDGLLGEIKELIDMGVTWGMQSMNTLGYKEWKNYFEGKESGNGATAKWTQDEKKYVKRQMTWFNKDKRVNWFDTTAKDWRGKVEKLVETWQNK